MTRRNFRQASEAKEQWPSNIVTSAQRIIIVSGLPRSGTSMLMAMLALGGVPILHDGLRASDPDNPNGYFEFDPVKRILHDVSWLGSAAGRAVKIVIPLVRCLPPGPACDVIFLLRDLSEVIASQAAMLTRLGRRAAAADGLLLKAFEREIDLTHKWLTERPDTRCLLLDHHSVVTRPKQAAAMLVSFLGQPLDEDAMSAAVDPALYRQRRRKC